MDEMGKSITLRGLLSKVVVKVINPHIGETVYDGAVGSAEFLCEAFDWMSKSKELSVLNKIYPFSLSCYSIYSAST